MKLDVVNIRGEKTGRSVDLSDEVFGIEPNDHIIYLDVKQYLINQRQGTHKAKQRNEISGSTRKLRKQKGGGGARVGGIKNPLFRGGGRIFGPQPRDYDIKINKKVKEQARKSALSYKAKDNQLIILEEFNMDQPKTKQVIEILNALNIKTNKTLLLLGDNNENIVKSVRNIPTATVSLSANLNTYSIVNANTIVMLESAVEKINQNLK